MPRDCWSPLMHLRGCPHFIPIRQCLDRSRSQTGTIHGSARPIRTTTPAIVELRSLARWDQQPKESSTPEEIANDEGVDAAHLFEIGRGLVADRIGALHPAYWVKEFGANLAPLYSDTSERDQRD